MKSGLNLEKIHIKMQTCKTNNACYESYTKKWGVNDRQTLLCPLGGRSTARVLWFPQCGASSNIDNSTAVLPSKCTSGNSFDGTEGKVLSRSSYANRALAQLGGRAKKPGRVQRPRSPGGSRAGRQEAVSPPCQRGPPAPTPQSPGGNKHWVTFY